MVWFETEYLGRPDETVQPVVAGNHVLFVHFFNGYHSLIDGVNNLIDFLDGEYYKRVACTDSEEELIRIIRTYE